MVPLRGGLGKYFAPERLGSLFEFSRLFRSGDEFGFVFDQRFLRLRLTKRSLALGSSRRFAVRASSRDFLARTLDGGRDGRGVLPSGFVRCACVAHAGVKRQTLLEIGELS